MITALYVFIGVMASYIGIYIVDAIFNFIKKVNRNANNQSDYQEYRAPESRYDNHYSSGESRLLYELRDALDRIEGSVDDLDLQLTNMNTKLDLIDSKAELLIEDAAELMVTKEHPEE